MKILRPSTGTLRLAATVTSAFRTAVPRPSAPERNHLGTESLRLTTLRYKNGESTVLEVVDAQTTATLANAAYEDGAVRYRVALANLQTLTGELTTP